MHDADPSDRSGAAAAADSPSGAQPRWITGYWGKARPDPQQMQAWHPLVYHCLDVAAAMTALLDARPVLRARIAGWFGCTPAEAVTFASVLAAWHDLGKFARAFQSKCPEHWHLGAAWLRGGSQGVVTTRTHPQDSVLYWSGIGSAQWRQWIDARIDVDDRTLGLCLDAAFGHHGRPVSATLDSAQINGKESFGSALDDVGAFMQASLSLLCPGPIRIARIPAHRAGAIQHAVAGLVVLADWVGSNTAYFEYREPLQDLSAYWADIGPVAARAVRELGLHECPAAPVQDFRTLTGLQSDPTPLQTWAASAPLDDGATLVILEDMTGAGKTEAAQVIVNRWMAAGRVNGAYWAMPTQATANAMFNRQSDALRALFAPDLAPTLALAHAGAALERGWRVSIMRPARTAATVAGIADAVPAAPRIESDATGEDLETATQSCAQFLSHDRRTSLLADMGSGTIDQALLAALPVRFNTLRLAALCGKAIVFDEVHAYDAYMRTEIEALLALLASLGGHVILMSATLRNADRTRLMRRWLEQVPRGSDGMVPARSGAAAGAASGAAAGNGNGNGNATGAAVTPRIARFGIHAAASRQAAAASVIPPVPDKSGYPLATLVRPDRVLADPVQPASRLRPLTRFRFTASIDEAIGTIVAMAAQGAAVVWIRNTVDDVLDARSRLQAAGIDPIVFHARFAQSDRHRIETAVVRRFGKEGPVDGRRHSVLVASQVVEQSLDLCFDYLVTDIAPGDLILQRIGRLRRLRQFDPVRPPQVPCEALIVGPDPAGDVQADWLKASMPGTSAVYRNDALIWKTASVLRALGQAPEVSGVRSFVERCYALDDVAATLERARETAHGNDAAQTAFAWQNVLRPVDPFSRDHNAYANPDDDRATRLIDDVVRVRLAWSDAGVLRPWSLRDAPDTENIAAAAPGDLIDSGGPDGRDRQLQRAWSRSEVGVRNRRRNPVREAVAPARWRAQVDALRAGWSTYEQNTKVVVLEPVPTQPGVWAAELDGPAGPISFGYSPVLGLWLDPAAMAASIASNSATGTRPPN